MSERVDRKLVEVPIARYGYRHEAEFASGFLEDAGIPYRLEVEDATLGIAASTSATIWVRGMDVERVRDLLELDDGSDGKRLTTDHRRVEVVRGQRPGRLEQGGWPVLTGLERGLSAILGGSLLLAAQFATTATPGLVPVLGIGGFLVALPAILGKAPRWMRGLLAGLTGGAP